jgi:hypothetical protein
LLDEDIVRVVYQSTFEEQQRAIVLEAMHQHDVGAAERIAGMTPFQLFGQLGREQDRPQPLELRAPVLLPAEVGVDLGAGLAFRHTDLPGCRPHL